MSHRGMGTHIISINMKKTFLLAAILLFVPLLVSAHTLQTDGNIGAVLHIDPNDDPVAMQPAHLYFSIQDTTKKFSPQNCNCSLTIALQNKSVLDQPITQTEASTIEIPFTFPTAGVYTVTLAGKPKTAGTFSNFSLIYNTRVERGAVTNSFFGFFIEHGLHILLFGIAIGANAYIFFRNRKNARGTNVSLPVNKDQ